MTLLQLIYFKTLARVLHYTRAAQELHISQPSLSYAINELEKELGAPLFTKERRNIQLTEYGERFLPYVNQALQTLEKGKNTLKEMTGEKQQTVSLGYFHSISASFIPPLIESFYQNPEYRNIHFKFEEGTSYQVLSRIHVGALDLGFTTHRNSEVNSAPVMIQPLYLTVPIEHPLAKKTAVTFEDFSHEPFIVLAKGTNLRDQVDRIFAQRNKVPKVVFEVQECNAALQYVSLNFGVSILPEVPGMKTARVVTLPIAESGADFTRKVYLTWDSSRIASPAVEVVKNYILTHYYAQ